MLFFRIRVFGAHKVPERGGVILASNHQSFLDPPAVGMAVRRHLYFVARRSLLRGRLAAALLKQQHVLPIDRDAPELAAIRAIVRRLRNGDGLVLFPEGTRTSDGSVGRFRPGFALVAARARVPVVPVAISGGFRAWPRWQRLPAWGPVRVMYGDPLPPPDGGKAACVAAAEEVRQRVVALLEELRQRE